MDYNNNSGFTKKEGQGSLFANDRKTSPNQPDFTGSIMIGGVDKRLAAWKRTAKNGSTYLSISISDFQGAQPGQGQGGYQSRGGNAPQYGGAPQYGAAPQYGGGYSQAPQPAAPAPGINDMPDFGGPDVDLPF